MWNKHLRATLRMHFAGRVAQSSPTHNNVTVYCHCLVTHGNQARILLVRTNGPVYPKSLDSGISDVCFLTLLLPTLQFSPTKDTKSMVTLPMTGLEDEEVSVGDK